jgi:hypothetical protein
MREHLWLADRGHFGEFKDLLGLQRVHPSAAVWTFYHTVDSEVPTPEEAWQMMRQVDTEIPRLPVRGPGVPAGLHTVHYSLDALLLVDQQCCHGRGHAHRAGFLAGGPGDRRTPGA